MSRFFSYLSSAEKVIGQYTGSEPLAAFLKDFFAQHKKMGSTDRKMIAQLCYQFFRLGHYGRSMPVYEKIMKAAALFPNENASLLSAVGIQYNREEIWQQALPFIFPFTHLLSKGMDGTAFSQSFLAQPSLFVRIRPSHETAVLQTLQQAKVPFQQPASHCIQLSNSFKIDQLLPVNKWVVVQDRSSQFTGQLLQQYLPNKNFAGSIWDCCAASGGKSIMLHDHFPNSTLTVSDIRDSILINLSVRFKEAGVVNFTSFKANLSVPVHEVPNAPFDMIVADVPCTGSGTWGRTPEALCFFHEPSIAHYHNRQLTIVKNALPFLKEKGYLLYITCSVFAEENEAIAGALQQQGLVLIHQQLIVGYTHAADTMYFALLQKQ